MARELTRRQQVFVSAYLGVAKGNASEAARIAEYKQPYVQGFENLENPRIREAIERDRAAIRQEGIATKQNRVDRLNQRWEEIRQIVAARAADPLVCSFPGGETGLLTVEPQLVKVYTPPDGVRGDDDDEADDGTLYSAKREKVVYVARLDTGLIKEERELAKSAAIEMGEWSEKKSDTPAVNVTVTSEIRTTTIGYADFVAEFARIAGVGTARQDGSPQPLDRAEADAAAGLLPRPARP